MVLHCYDHYGDFKSGRHHDFVNRCFYRYIPFVVVTLLSCSSFMTYNQICNKSNMIGAIIEAENTHPSEAPEVIPGFFFSVVRLP